ncbi:MAG: right-handed parallel beta-helix repeat-containing protein [Vicinamibacterales bacterium]
MLKPLGLAFAVLGMLPNLSTAAPARPAPPLPLPSGFIVNVSSEPELLAAMATLASNTTIVLAPGTYRLRKTLYINGTFTDVGIRGATENPDDVVLIGPGMTDGSVHFGVWVGGNVQGVTIANLTIRDVFRHPIVLNAGTQSPLIHNVRLVNAGQQFVKSNPNPAGGGVDNGIVEYSVIEYDSTSRDDYTNGVDVHTGRNWIIRHNLFRNIRAPKAGTLAGPAILMWNGSANTIAEGNTFINCQREIAFGLVTRTPDDHRGGMIRNNVIYRDPSMAGGDVGIGVFDSPNTQVLHNTIIASGTYPSRIEYRFPDTTGVVIANNLLDGAIQSRDGALATIAGNVISAARTLFQDAAAGDLRLTAAAAASITKVPATAECPVDFDGDPRPPGSVTDVGADEYRLREATAPRAP